MPHHHHCAPGCGRAQTMILPQLYWKAESNEIRIEMICKALKALCQLTDEQAEQIGTNRKEIAKLASEFEEFKAHGFEDYYLEQIESWIETHLAEIMHILIRQVYFGLNEQGYFVAYVPESWSDIVFDTGVDYSLDTYGRLILRFNVDDPNETVNQTPEVVRPNYNAELAQDVSNMMNTLYATE